MIPLSRIREFPRSGIDNFKVNKFVAMMRNGTKMDPIAVCNDGDKLLIRSGFHRFCAYEALNLAEIPVVFVPAAIKANSRSGRP